jgi:hypothetical protein
LFLIEALILAFTNEDGIAQFGVEIPGQLDKAWGRCKKVTGTLVTLKRLASVQVRPLETFACS